MDLGGSAIQPANATRAWVPDALHYGNSDLMVKIQDYVPPVKEELEYQVEVTKDEIIFRNQEKLYKIENLVGINL